MGFYRCTIFDPEDQSDYLEFFLEGDEFEVWKTACIFLHSSDYSFLEIFRPGDDSLCYQAFDSTAGVVGKFVPIKAADVVIPLVIARS